MGSLRSMRECADEIATNIALLYIDEAERLGVEIKYIEEDTIGLTRNINIERGVIEYRLKGTLGDKINNPDILIGIYPDLLRGLRRGESAYNRHSKNIPTAEEIEGLTVNMITTLLLLKLASTHESDKKYVSTHPKVIKKILEFEEELNALKKE